MPALRVAVDRSLDIALERGIRLSINDQRMLQGIDLARAKKAARAPMPEHGLNFPGTWNKAWETLEQDVNGRSKVALHHDCFKPYHYVYVAADGRVGTCNHMMDPLMLEMGNLNTSTFGEIWNNQAYQVFRRELITATPQDQRCQWCFKNRLED